MDSYSNVPKEDTGSSEVFDDLGAIADVDGKYIRAYDSVRPILCVHMTNYDSVLGGDLYFDNTVIGGEYLLGALPMNTLSGPDTKQRVSVDPQHPFYREINRYREKRPERAQNWQRESIYPTRRDAANSRPRNTNGQFTSDKDVQ